MGFEPIAIVGRACILPEALTPSEFWHNISTGRESLTRTPLGRWRLSPTGENDGIGGYVEGFDKVFDPTGFALDAEQLHSLDPLFHWVLHGTREALRESRYSGSLSRAGLVLGNLSYPSEEGSRYAEHVWFSPKDSFTSPLLDGVRPDPRSRFSSGLPAILAAKALGLGEGAFSLDAACASSLYAIKLACDRFQDCSADLMLAGGVNRADNLTIHSGFSALRAKSQSGRSRPFHAKADGLVPAEGAGFVALMRLEDAIAAKTPIFGVIRGIGLSNDGRAKGLLVPSREGQEKALRLAYASAGVEPETVSLLECHATGTPVGDLVEVQSAAKVFAQCSDLPIGSVKSNIGHSLATAGIAGLLKVLGAMEAGIRPPTLGVDDPLEELSETPLRVLIETEEWPGLRRAGISAFGFGGSNAHLIVDSWSEVDGIQAKGWPTVQPQSHPLARQDDPIVIVALGARVGAGSNVEDFRRAVLDGQPQKGRRATIDIALSGLRFPPHDLAQTLPQQLLMFEAAREAASKVPLPPERTMVLIGMGVDAEAARSAAYSRISSSSVEPKDQLDRWAAEWAAFFTAATVTGTMPNIVANRISAQLDLTGPSFTVSAEESSGLVVLELAARALRAGEVDAALIGAVDLSYEPVHQSALAELDRVCQPGDAAVALVLKRLSDARSAGDPVLAVLEDAALNEKPDLVLSSSPSTPGQQNFDPTELFGTAHAAVGLVSVATAVIALGHRIRPSVDRSATQDLSLQTIEVVSSAQDGPSMRVRLRGGDSQPWLSVSAPKLYVYSGQNRQEVLSALDTGNESMTGPARLAIVVEAGQKLTDRIETARRWLVDKGPRLAGIAYQDAPLGGEIGFVFTNGSACYPEMGRVLALAFPSLINAAEKRHGLLPVDPVGKSSAVLDQIWDSARLATWQVEITRSLLGIQPQAALGYSSGESAALVALGAWTDTAEFCTNTRASGLFTEDLTAEMPVIRQVWQQYGLGEDRWVSYLVNASADVVRAALVNKPAVHLMAINAPNICVVGGAESVCSAVVRDLDSSAIPLDYDLAAHIPELAGVRDKWWKLHARETREVPGVRFYRGANADSYLPNRESAADALTAQALGTIDFAQMIEQAWSDGVRVFIEHGPRSLCTGWIRRTLGDREYLAVSLDAPEDHGLRQLCFAVAELVAAGVPVRAREFFAELAAAAGFPPSKGKVIQLAAHPPLVPPFPAMETLTAMPRAPWLSPVGVQSGLTLVEASLEMPAAVSPVASTSRVVNAVAAHRQRVTALHHDFLTRQAETHTRFLQTRQQALIALVQRVRTGQNPEIPEIPVFNGNPTSPLFRPADKPLLPGPKFDRAQLEQLATGSISELFGPLFAAQDSYPRQTRLPGPPLLLVSRVTGIDAEPASMGTGIIWTETDVVMGDWYLDSSGRMPFSLMIEVGQADLLLISWLGADLLNKGERVYRLLGCELVYHGGGRPKVGETLCDEIHIDSHVEHDGVRLFFFHYDCRVNDELRLTVRNGQAGFFTDEELANSGGVQWSPESWSPPADVRLDPPAVALGSRSFSAAEVCAFAEGRAFDCFGAKWTATKAHIRSPRISDGDMRLIHEVTEFDPTGGPWGRGYLRAELPITPDSWFFDAHFKNDPCMPGTLVLEAGMQAMSFYLAAMGFTIERDGWVFEPVPERDFQLRCRGQVTPKSQKLVVEIFVSEVTAGPVPMLVADVLATVDGVKAFHGHQAAIRLVPDWPLEQWRHLGPSVEQETGEFVAAEVLGGLVGYQEPKPVATVEGFAFDYPSLLACAWGKPSDAFGPSFVNFDSTRQLVRLPGPPYHFMSRVVSVEGPLGGVMLGSKVTVEYDVPEKSWYFEETPDSVMPLAVLMEVALQPCGWLSVYVGSPLMSTTDLVFRNLDGTATTFAEIRPDVGTLRTEVELRTSAQHGDTIIQSFQVRCFSGEAVVFEMDTVFGFFTKEALAKQVGLTLSNEDHARAMEDSEYLVDLTDSAMTYSAPLPGSMLLMLDRITGYWPRGGQAGLGRLRAEKDVDAEEWFFKAHFFTDPVQPGSLGVEAMGQLLRFYLTEIYLPDSDLTSDGKTFRCEPVLLGHELTWKYRGQVVPTDGRITIELDIVEVSMESTGCRVIAEAWLWVDGLPIYHVRNLSVHAMAAELGRAGD